MPGARTMWATAVLASALVRLATVLTAVVPSGYGGGGGYSGDCVGEGGEGVGEGEGGEGEGGGGNGAPPGGHGGNEGGVGEGGDGDGGEGGEGGGAGQVEIVPETPSVRVVGQEQTVPPQHA